MECWRTKVTKPVLGEKGGEGSPLGNIRVCMDVGGGF